MIGRTLGLVAVALAAGCDLPRDAAGTLHRVEGGTMRVGTVVHPPWVIDSGDAVGGVEPMLVRTLAHELGAGVVWIRGTESDLLRALHRRELDLVVGGLTADSPWKAKVALTRPYYTDSAARPTPLKRVLAAPAGENAWLVRVERLLREQRSSLAALHPAPAGTVQ